MAMTIQLAESSQLNPLDFWGAIFGQLRFELAPTPLVSFESLTAGHLLAPLGWRFPFDRHCEPIAFAPTNGQTSAADFGPNGANGT